MIKELEGLLNLPASRKRRAVKFGEEGALEDVGTVEEKEEAPMHSRAREEKRKAEEKQRRADADRAAETERLRLQEERKLAHNRMVEEQQRRNAEIERLRLQEERKAEHNRWVEQERKRKEEEKKKSDEVERIQKENQRKAQEEREKQKESQNREESEKRRTLEETKLLEYEKEVDEYTERKEEEDLNRWAEKEAERLQITLPPDHAFYGEEIIQLVKGKDPNPELHYLQQKDPFVFGNTFKKFVKKFNLIWDPKERMFIDVLNQMQKNITAFKAMYEAEEFDSNFLNKTEAEKREILEIAKAIQFFFLTDIGRFSLKLGDDRIDHVTLSDQIGYVLGYEQKLPIKNGQISKYMADLHGGVSHLCIYLNSGLIVSYIDFRTFANIKL